MCLISISQRKIGKKGIKNRLRRASKKMGNIENYSDILIYQQKTGLAWTAEPES